MTKQEFLEKLRMALAGKVSASEVADNISYYDDYINTQMRMGRSESEVVASLGDPRLLAKSIVEAGKHAGGVESAARYEESYDRSGGYGYGQEQRSGRQGRPSGIPGWLIVFLVFFVIILVIGAVFSVLSFLAPILIPLLLAVVLIRILKRT